nr:response regulator [Brucepastera parasyntrophica]
MADNGIGMTNEQISKLFIAFEQTDSNISARFGGTGLGLAISHSLVSKMGGFITVQSQPERGSLFSFTINMEKVGTDQNPEEQKTEFIPDLKGRRILIVEDIKINRLILLELLADTGIEMEEAEDGDLAVQKFSDSPEGYYDLIFMDVQMPSLDGYEATRRIRALDRKDAASVSIIAMTANAYREDVEAALQSGMNGHIAKPIDIDSVMRILDKTLNG